MRDATVSRNYAEVLLTLARRAEDLPGWGKLIQDVASAMEDDATLRLFLESPKVSEAQKLIVEGRMLGEKLRAEMIEETRGQQQEMLERARREIEAEKTRAIFELRREAVELAIAGASKVIEKNLDDQSNRKIVESFLASIPVTEPKRG